MFLHLLFDKPYFYQHEKITPFSFSTDPEDVQIDQVSCWLTYTNEKTHEIIRNNLDRSPIYAGVIEGTGFFSKYCKRSIHSGQKSLCSCFFIAAASVKLSPAEQSLYFFKLQSRKIL